MFQGKTKDYPSLLGFFWKDLEQVGIEGWWRWRPPLMLILLKNFITQRFLPPNLPPNDRLRKADL